MKVIAYDHYGPPNVLRLKEVPKPSPKIGELLLRVRAVEVTKADCELRSFRFPVHWFWLPLRLTMGITKPRRQVLGSYFAAEIEALGEGASKFEVGDRIFGTAHLRLGAYGEYLCLPETYPLVTMPSNLSFEEAAAVPLGGLNALHFMRLAEIEQGESVLINGAGGSIGIFALQIAKDLGGHVTAVDRSIKEGMLRQIGADHFIDYSKSDFTKSDQKYDVIFNMVARVNYSAAIKCLKPGGRWLSGNPQFFHLIKPFLTNLFSDKRAITKFAGEKEEELIALKDMIEAKRIKPVVDNVYPMEEAVLAHQRVENEDRLGAVVLTMGRAK
ncbi:MAG: alcohol dehydrogenase [Candidatus Entotheonella gemina]|uniref:Alcohol dehydrogenase n=1 Tax=Candidatus Entotheonella gemina TaxID=1429439 RepID=W4M158_9BACT|nr:MAG: alcohol dehydrogenase [Candidatus Entotheonella gemina]